MTKKQRILTTLNKQRLIEIAGQFEISGLTGYSKSDIVLDLTKA